MAEPTYPLSEIPVRFEARREALHKALTQAFPHGCQVCGHPLPVLGECQQHFIYCKATEAPNATP